MTGVLSSELSDLPIFSSSLELNGGYSEYFIADYAVALWRRAGNGTSLPPSFINTRHLPPAAHLDMQAAIQPFVDQAISKTINVPVDYGFAEFHDLYLRAYNQGLKGCTTFCPNPVTGEILQGRKKDRRRYIAAMSNGKRIEACPRFVRGWQLRNIPLQKFSPSIHQPMDKMYEGGGRAGIEIAR